MYNLSPEEKEYIRVQLQDSREFLQWLTVVNPQDKNAEIELTSVNDQISNLIRSSH